MSQKTDLERIATLENELALLKKSVENKTTGNPHVFAPTNSEKAALIISNIYTGNFMGLDAANHDGKMQYAFRNKKAAEAWADALNVMMELRSQPGAVPYCREEDSWYIVMDVSARFLCLLKGKSLSGHILGGGFSTEEALNAAILKVGADRIKKAFKTLVGEV